MPLSRLLVLFGLTAMLSACAAKSADERLDLLEARTGDQELLELRVDNLEERTERIEASIGELRDCLPERKAGDKQAAPAAKAQPARKASNGRLPAEPQPTGVLIIPPEGLQAAYIERPEPSATEAPVAAQAAPAEQPAVEAGQEAAPALVPLSSVGAPAEPAVSEGLAEAVAKGGKPVTPAPSAQAESPAAPKSAPGKAPAGQSAYDAALALYNKGQYAQARRDFADFVASNPKSPLLPNARYWQGECEYSLGNYDAAILIFKDVALAYPKHPKAAASLLKAGYSYERLKDLENARFYWQILLDDFPKSAPAQLARQRMTAA